MASPQPSVRRGGGDASRSSATRTVVVLAVVGLLSLAIAVGVDRLAVGIVERQVAGRLQTSLGTAQPPTVEITGFPFLTQVVRRDFSSVHVVGDGLGATNGAATRIAQMDLLLHDVVATDRYRRLTAARVEGTAQLEYAALDTLAGVPVRYAGDGRVELQAKTTFLRLPVEATVTGTPEVDVNSQTVSLGNPGVTVGGIQIPSFTARALLSSLVQPVPLTDIPLGLKVEKMTAGEQYLDVSLTGRDVVVSG
jgi:hypothetical protein